ncbi:MAG TPA: hypothetical protein VLL51_11065 [Gemmatimonadales bacterium]|nr:hypothetical protein [Gemmatimonadales bacterium]
MSAVLSIAVAAGLFVLFGLLRRGREPEGGCGGCAGGSCGHCTFDDSVIPFPRSDDVRS